MSIAATLDEAPASRPLDRAAAARAVDAPPIAWHGDDATLARLIWWHALLTVLTLGFYRFWAKVAFRQRLWSSIRIAGRPLRYTGTVREALVPFVAAVVVLLAVAGMLWIAKMMAVPRPPMPRSQWRFAGTLPMVFLIGLSLWKARDYLLSRTMLAEGTGRLDGDRMRFALLYLGAGVMTGVSAGFALPWRQIWLQRWLIGGMSIGPHKFEFGGDPRALLRRFLLVWLGGLVIYLAAVLTLAATMGAKIVAASEARRLPALDRQEVLIALAIAVVAGAAFALLAAWYRAHTLRHMAAATRIDGRTLQLDLPVAGYVRMAVENALIKLGSLFLLAPLAEMRHTRFLIRCLR